MKNLELLLTLPPLFLPLKKREEGKQPAMAADPFLSIKKKIICVQHFQRKRSHSTTTVNS